MATRSQIEINLKKREKDNLLQNDDLQKDHLDHKEIDNYPGLLKLVHTAENNIYEWVKKYSRLILIVKDDERWQEDRANSYASTLKYVNILSNIFTRE